MSYKVINDGREWSYKRGEDVEVSNEEIYFLLRKICSVKIYAGRRQSLSLLERILHQN
jgi:hypothetical protein